MFLGKYEWTALSLASLNGHVDVVRLLLEHNAQIGLRCRVGGMSDRTSNGLFCDLANDSRSSPGRRYEHRG